MRLTDMGEKEAHAQIKAAIESNDITVFMKGTPAAPQCGFSAHVVQILNSYGKTYHAINVLEDWDLREGIKSYANWPTIPQIYVKGKFIGGCDITAEMHRKGELKAVLDQV
jgi:monothiol glutaredoxin